MLPGLVEMGRVGEEVSRLVRPGHHPSRPGPGKEARTAGWVLLYVSSGSTTPRRWDRVRIGLGPWLSLQSAGWHSPPPMGSSEPAEWDNGADHPHPIVSTLEMGAEV